MQSANKQAVGLFFFGLSFFSIVTGLFLFSFVRDYTEIKKLHRSGVITQGIVFIREVAHDPEKYFVTYQFTPEKGARWFTGTGNVSQATYNTARPGQPVTIIYVRDKPTISRIQGEDHYAYKLSEFVFMLLIEMFLLLFLILFVILFVRILVKGN